MRLLIESILVVCLLAAHAVCQTSNMEYCDIVQGNNSMSIVQLQASCMNNNTTVYLQFENSSLPSLPDIFGAFPQLLSLDVSTSNVSRIDNNIFLKAVRLTTLHLFNNSISRIEPYTFSKTHDLSMLNFASNRINKIEIHAFIGLTALKNLDLSMNELKVLDEGIFQPLVKLQSIRLTSNHIQVIDDTLFSSNHDLRQIYLDKNEITAVDNKAFQAIKAPRYLEMSNNLIKGVDFLRQVDKVKEIFVANCNITTLFIPNSAKDITASNNSISRIVSTNASVVEFLNVANNSLTHLEDVNNFTNIETLNLSYNRLNSIDFSKLANLTRLKQISFLGNNITTLNITAINTFLPQLKIIDVSLKSFDREFVKNISNELLKQSIFLMDENKNIINPGIDSVVNESVLKLIDDSKEANSSAPLLDPESPFWNTSTDVDYKGSSEKMTNFLNTELAKMRQNLINVQTTLNSTIANITAQNLQHLKNMLELQNQDAKKMIQQSQEHVNYNSNIEAEVRHIKSIVIFFVVLLCGFAVFKIGIFVKDRYFKGPLMMNPLHTRSMSTDSFNPIFEERL